jgi:ubiquinone/menaquinone biosynthesis C-methylase UbiE
LVFAPELIILQRLRKLLPPTSVKTTDFNSIDVDFPNEDIQALSFSDQSFRLIICNHVLEHIPDDNLALAECARILHPGGIAVFTIPGDFRKPKTWHFSRPDSNGHFRHYGLEVIEQMKRHFGEVKAIDMSEVAEPSSRVRPYDYAFLCNKQINKRQPNIQ